MRSCARRSRGRVHAAALLLPWSEGSLEGLPSGAEDPRALVVPVPVEPSAPGAGATAAPPGGTNARDIAVLTYGANPHKKGLDRILSAWRRARESSSALAREELVIAGVAERDLRRGGWLTAAAEGVR